jgi:hypothetical protein
METHIAEAREIEKIRSAGMTQAEYEDLCKKQAARDEQLVQMK